MFVSRKLRGTHDCTVKPLRRIYFEVFSEEVRSFITFVKDDHKAYIYLLLAYGKTPQGTQVGLIKTRKGQIKDTS